MKMVLEWMSNHPVLTVILEVILGQAVVAIATGRR